MDDITRRYFDDLTIDVADCEIEADGEHAVNCECCGQNSRTIWGYVHRHGGETLASYYIQWTEGASLASHPANFDLIIGPWGEGSVPKDRCAVSLINFENENGPGVMVVNASDRPISDHPNAGIIAAREHVVGTPFARTVFDLFDAIFLGDARLR